MSTIQNLKIALKEALEREQALIEVFEREIDTHFEGKEKERAKAIFIDNIDRYEENLYIPSLSDILQVINGDKERAKAWRDKQAATPQD